VLPVICSVIAAKNASFSIASKVFSKERGALSRLKKTARRVPGATQGTIFLKPLEVSSYLEAFFANGQVEPVDGAVGVVKVGVVRVGVVVVGGSDGENNWGACGVWENDNDGVDTGESSKLSLSASI
jgi:hypothetical protein